MSLPGSRVLVGERISEALWEEATKVPKYTMLLYPLTPIVGQTPPLGLDPYQLKNPSRVRLVVIDATWRKSRKILHLNPVLQRLPRMTLDAVPESRYAIRKAHKPGQLSTLEATCAALSQLGANPTAIKSLLTAFDGFVAQQAQFSLPR